MKKKATVALVLSLILAASACESKPAETSAFETTGGKIEDIKVVTEAKSTTTEKQKEKEETTTTVTEEVKKTSSEEKQSANTEIVYRSYKYVGEEDGTMSFEPYILVEYNYKKKYVSFYMQFIGVNAYLSPEWDDSLNVLDGSYWIQDFQNADGSEPDLTKVYVTYSPEKITLCYWDKGEERFLTEYPQEFVYQPD